MDFKIKKETGNDETLENEHHTEFFEIGETTNKTVRNKSAFVNHPTHEAVKLFQIFTKRPPEVEEETNANIEEEFIGFDEPTISQEQFEIRNEFGEIIEIYQPTDDHLQHDIQDNKSETDDETETAKRIETLLKCELCNGTFSNEQALKAHNDFVHLPTTTKTQFICEFCNKSFPLNYKLRLHVRTVHAKNERSLLKCIFCPESFYIDFHLKQHILNTHAKEGGVPIIKCKFCSQTFDAEKDLSSHIRDVHLMQLNSMKNRIKYVMKCQLCKKVLPDADSVRKHLCNVPIKKCQFCNKTFKEVSKMKEHLATNHKGKVLFISKNGYKPRLISQD